MQHDKKQSLAGLCWASSKCEQEMRLILTEGEIHALWSILPKVNEFFRFLSNGNEDRVLTMEFPPHPDASTISGKRLRINFLVAGNEYVIVGCNDITPLKILLRTKLTTIKGSLRTSMVPRIRRAAKLTLQHALWVGGTLFAMVMHHEIAAALSKLIGAAP